MNTYKTYFSLYDTVNISIQQVLVYKDNKHPYTV